MARVVISVFVFLFLFTLSRARDLHAPETNEPETTTRPHNFKPQKHDTVLLTLDSIDPLPLTLHDFRPVNRHIHPRRSLPLPLSLSLRRCRHGHRRQIPYGNDMIVHSDASTGDRQIPLRWTVFRPLSEISGDDTEYHHHHHAHSQRHHHHHHEKGWFAKRINEFLNLF